MIAHKGYLRIRHLLYIIKSSGEIGAVITTITDGILFAVVNISISKDIKHIMKLLKKIFSKSSAAKTNASLVWTNELSGMDDISTIEYCTKKLNEDYKNELFKDEQYLKAFFSIDEKTHSIVERITSHYINIENISIELEERITQSVFFYHRQIFLVYFSLVENMDTEDCSLLTIMLGRAMNSATQMIKWRYYNFNSSPANVWQQIAQLYKVAEQKSLVNNSLAIYSEQEPITLSIAYIQACMLGSLESLSFKRQQIDLVSKLLAKWTAKVVVESIYDEKKHLFYVDTASNVPARRIRNFLPADSYRYWCFDSINSKIELCISAIEFNISPRQLALGEFITNKYFLSTLEVLRSEWSRAEYKRQRRSEERTKLTKTASANYGFEDTCNQIKQNENIQVQRGEKTYRGEKSFEERLASHNMVKGRTEPSIVYMDLGAGYANIVDESGKGIGLRVNKQANEVSLGMMVGVSVKEPKYAIIVGVIRSIKPVGGHELNLGIEVLSKTAFCVEAKNTTFNAVKGGANINHISSGNYNNGTANFTCLYVPEEYGISTQETLIVPRLQFNKNDTFKVNILGSEMHVKFTDTLERHEDWIRVSYVEDVGSQLVKKLAS